MNQKLYTSLAAVMMCAVLLLSACTPAATPVVEETVVPTEVATEVPTETPPCLIIGALYGGPITDAGYNQSMHESVMAVKQNIDCVQIIEAENVPDEAGATSTMENMIQQGAKLIFATGFNHQYPALALSQTYPDVIFESAGGWEMGANFANFFPKPPDAWYMMGVAAGMMTTTNKLGFVANAPQAWALVFINAFELGAKSVNPDAQTIVGYTMAWGDRTKEAETTNALINEGCDVITMNVDSPSTVITTAEERGVYSIGYQNLAAQQFAPENWITGTGLTLGGTLTWITSMVLDGSWNPIFVRCSMADGCMEMAPFGPKVPQEVQDAVMQAKADLEAGTVVTFAGPILDQDGNVKIAAGEVLTDEQMSTVDWLVQGVVGSPK
jgi:basic membrane protein A and related proteins